MKAIRSFAALFLALTVLVCMALPTAAFADDVVIRFMTWEGEAMNKAILATMDKFMAENPGIKVELEPSPLTDYGIKLQEMLAAGIAPDIFMVGNDMALNYDANELVLDLKPFLDADPDFVKGFYPGVLVTYTNGERVVGLPGLINMYGIFYNKQFFDDAGLTYPAIGWTYADMVAAAEALKDTASGRFGLCHKGNDVFQTAIYSASKDGSGFCDAIFPVSKVQASNSFREGVTLISGAIKSGAITPPTWDETNITANFMQGAIPMFKYGQWAADEIIRNAPDTLKWGYAPSPLVNKNAQIIDAVGWCINAQPSNAEAAFKVLKFLESETYKEVLGQTPVAPPAFMAAAEGYYAKLTEAGAKDMADALDYMLNAEIKLPVRFLDPWGAKAQKFLEAEWNTFITGERPVAELDALVTEINEVIESSK